MSVLPRGAGMKAGLTPSGAGEDTEWHRGYNILPPLPAVKLLQVVGPHQPDEPDAGVHGFQCINSLGGEVRSDPGFVIADNNAAISQYGSGMRNARLQRRRSALLEWVAG